MHSKPFVHRSGLGELGANKLAWRGHDIAFRGSDLC